MDPFVSFGIRSLRQFKESVNVGQKFSNTPFRFETFLFLAKSVRKGFCSSRVTQYRWRCNQIGWFPRMFSNVTKSARKLSIKPLLITVQSLGKKVDLIESSNIAEDTIEIGVAIQELHTYERLKIGHLTKNRDFELGQTPAQAMLLSTKV